MSTLSQSDHSSLVLYADLMEEIKTRLASISDAATGKLPIHPRLAYEHCYLQLRMVCELIALSCLVMHQDIPETESKRLRKAYEPGVIIDALEELHQSFYPQPGEQVLDSLGNVVRVENLSDGFLTKLEVKKLWAEAGDVLHRGSRKNLELRLQTSGSFEEVGRYCQRIVRLLNHHQIALKDSTSQVWVLMHGKDDGKVHFAVMELIVKE